MNQLGSLASDLTRQYTQLAGDCGGAGASSSNPEVAGRLSSAVTELGRTSIDIVRSAGACQATPSDTVAQRDVADNARAVSEKVFLLK